MCNITMALARKTIEFYGTMFKSSIWHYTLHYTLHQTYELVHLEFPLDISFCLVKFEASLSKAEVNIRDASRFF